MKKNYIKPTVNVYLVNTRQNLLQASATSAGVSSDDYNGGTIKSRSYSFGDEE